ncbi:unnamed protein product [Lampetra planeri]
MAAQLELLQRSVAQLTVALAEVGARSHVTGGGTRDRRHLADVTLPAATLAPATFALAAPEQGAIFFATPPAGAIGYATPRRHSVHHRGCRGGLAVGQAGGGGCGRRRWSGGGAAAACRSRRGSTFGRKNCGRVVTCDRRLLDLTGELGVSLSIAAESEITSLAVAQNIQVQLALRRPRVMVACAGAPAPAYVVAGREEEALAAASTYDRHGTSLQWRDLLGTRKVATHPSHGPPPDVRRPPRGVVAGVLPAGRADASWIDALCTENTSLSSPERQRLRDLVVRATAVNAAAGGPTGGGRGGGPVSIRTTASYRDGRRRERWAATEGACCAATKGITDGALPWTRHLYEPTPSAGTAQRQACTRGAGAYADGRHNRPRSSRSSPLAMPGGSYAPLCVAPACPNDLFF